MAANIWPVTARSLRQLEISLRRRYSTYFGVRFGRRPPVVVYQMGKVASSAVRNSLLLHGGHPVLHLHSFFPYRHMDVDRAVVDEELREPLRREIDHARRVFDEAPLLRKANFLYREKIYNERIYDLCVRSDREAFFITLVRDPVAANLSMFFQLFEEYVGADYEPGLLSSREIAERFVSSYDHSRPLTWFDAEMKRWLGVDVYRHPFPKEVGHQSIQEGRRTLLILQAELDDATKERAISELLGLEGFRMMRSNVGSEKPYGPQYREVKEILQLPDDLLDRMYGSKYARHFYTPAALQEFRARWAGSAAP